MKYDQPDLPYANDALEPAISRQTIEFHYGKHEKAYIDNLNALIEGTEFEDLPLEEIIRDSNGALFNNASQAWNHIFYFSPSPPTAEESPTATSGPPLTVISDRSSSSRKSLWMPE